MASNDREPRATLSWQVRWERREHNYAAYLMALMIVATCGMLSWGMEQLLGVENGFLVFLLGVGVVAAWYGLWPSVWASILSTGVLAFFFMPPIFSFAVADIQHIFTLFVMVTIGVVVSGLTSQVMHHAEESRRNAERFESLYRLSRDLAALAGSEHLARAAVKHIEAVFGGSAVVLLPDAGRGLLEQASSALGGAKIPAGEYGYGFRPVPAMPLASSFRAVEWTAARAARESRQWAGLGTYSVPNATALFVPLASQHGHLGVLALRPGGSEHSISDEQRQMLTTLAGQIVGALERDRLSHEVQSAQDEAETERMRSALLSSVSHDLRTPLAAIAGSSSSMLDEAAPLSPRVARELCQTIFDNANRLSHIVDNILNMTRIESGVFNFVKQQHVLEEVIGSTLARMGEPLRGRRIETRLPHDLPLVSIDDILFQQVLVNLLDNAQRYVPPESPLEIAAWTDDRRLTLEVADRGPGFLEGEENRVFEKFYRGVGHRHDARGTGLGLTICRAIIAAHGGTIHAANRDGGGAVFRICLPLTATHGESEPVATPAGEVVATATTTGAAS